MKELSVIIPARSEMFLMHTIQDLLANIEADTEVIAVLDGAWADPGIPQDSRVNIIYVPEPGGQRAGQNLAARLAQGKYIMKVDAHCAFDKGFDRKMLEAFAKVGDDVTMVPVMRNLWAFDWKCYTCGSRWYQGPTPKRCMKHIMSPVEQNGKIVQKAFIVPNESCTETRNFRRKMVWRTDAKPGESGYYNWKGGRSPANVSYRFDSEPHFQYFNEYRKRPDVAQMIRDTGFNETMSLQGSCFMATREKYFSLPLCNESFGSWGNQGIEVALATWLSGGRVLVNHETWYGHMFRTQGRDFSFPYPQDGRVQRETKKKTWENFLNGGWPHKTHSISWLVEKFWPVPGWTEQDLESLRRAEQWQN